MQDVSQLLNILLHEKNVLNHHSIFLACQILRPVPYSQGNPTITVLPPTGCIVHCQLNSGQILNVLQPRFERGRVSKCLSNVLQLAVYDHTNLILFLPGQIGIYDLFECAPEGRILNVWHIDARNKEASSWKSKSSNTALPTAVQPAPSAKVNAKCCAKSVPTGQPAHVAQ